MIFDPLVSVIIPCFNCEAYIRDAINSTVTQSYKNIEIIVIDDGSSDGSALVINEYAHAVQYVLLSNRGAAAARNYGLEMSSGQYVKFLDADDILLPGSIAAQVAIADSLNSLQFSVGRSLKWIQNSGVISSHAYRDGLSIHNPDILDFILDAPLISAPLYPRIFLDNLNGFDENLGYREDYDLFLRALISGFEPVPDNTPVFIYRDHSAPDRISQQPVNVIAPVQLEMFRSLYKLLILNAGNDKAGVIANGLALAIWQSGRNVLRAKLTDMAGEYFSLAKQCNSRRYIHGRRVYTFLTAIAGPYFTESMLTALKKPFK